MLGVDEFGGEWMKYQEQETGQQSIRYPFSIENSLNNRPKSHRVKEAKKQIQSIIQDLSAKRSMNHETMSLIKKTNQEVSSFFRRNQSGSAYPASSHKDRYTTADRSSNKVIENAEVSHFDIEQPTELLKSCWKHNQLNQTIKLNNALLEKCADLSHENSCLLRGDIPALTEQNRQLRKRISQFD